MNEDHHTLYEYDDFTKYAVTGDFLIVDQVRIPTNSSKNETISSRLSRVVVSDTLIKTDDYEGYLEKKSPTMLIGY